MARCRDTDTDTVFVNRLQVNVNIGPDCWSKARPQPAEISVFLHLYPAFLDLAGDTDDVLDSVHYGHLAKAISTLVDARTVPWAGAEGLADAVTEEAFALAGDACAEVRVVVELPKMILLAAGFSVDVTTTAAAAAPDGGETRSRSKKVEVKVKDLVLATIIGVNPPEREAKQRVITNLVFYEEGEDERFARILGSLNRHEQSQEGPVDYPQLVKDLSKDIEESSHLTLEKFVRDVARKACLHERVAGVHAITVRAQKPSAISFAHSSGVEVTRTRASFLGSRPAA
ncbi:hypothetical protein FIBSPDRAFT_921461 [Athelia psychrophila]|uniref:dihydroneopterin aldolase n=1 Tax=Athelia psychrophila TaxID=1759441 RepID=A0A166CSW0_9AGAM|nr:hypothetical protein FIBSPDRAFT_921461 [Fibularhizoctonia sp. CBS 109695]